MIDENKGVLDNFKVNIYLVIVIAVFIILCVSYVLVIPVFEAPDEPGHFLYAFYISKYNKLPSQYNESISTEQYIKENIDENVDRTFYIDSKYMFYKIRDSGSSGYLWNYRDQRHQPPLYYLISSQIIKPFGVSDIDAEINYESYNEPNRFINNSILRDSSSTNFLVLILRLFQVIYGVLIIIFVYKIIELLSNGRFERKSALLISGIAFLPQFLFLCSYVNNDVLSVLFGLISVYFAVLLFKRDKAYFGLLSILFSIIASLTKPTILIMLPLAITGLIAWAVTKKRKWSILGIFIILILIGAGFYLIASFGKESYKDVKVEVGWDDNYREGSELSPDEKADDKNQAANYGISLDGKSNRISVSSTPSSAVEELTVESRVYFNKFNKSTGGISTPVISDWNSWYPDNQKGYLLRTYYSPKSDTLTWYFQVCDGVNVRSVNFDQLPYDDFTQKYANKWLHVSGVLKGGEYIKFLLNGEVKGTLETDVPEKMEPEKDTLTWFGYSGINAGYMDGIIDEVRIWNIALNEKQIQDNMYKKLTGNEEGLAGYWNFDEGRFSTVYDSTQNKNHGTIYKTIKYSSPLLNRILTVGSNIITKFKDASFKEGFSYAGVELPLTFKSSVAVFGWMNIFADKFIYNYFLAYVISGILLFFVNIKKYKNNKKSLIFIIVSIVSIFIYFLLYAAYSNWAQQQGRIIMLAVILTFALAVAGFGSVKKPVKDTLCYTLFSCSLFVSIFCLYNYIYLSYY